MPASNRTRRFALHWPLYALLALAGCVGAPPRQAPSPTPLPEPTLPAPPPPDIASIPEPTPRIEPRSRRGNPPFYEVLGKRYFVLTTEEGYHERGVASWYGPGFHAAKTSNGERYDMYAMTAAHKTLPLPSYVQVTNLSNGRSVVVRVNDRGPFKDGRIIDLSYSAAHKLDMLKAGTTFVEVKALTPGVDAASNPSAAGEGRAQRAGEGAGAAKPLYVQAGAFSTQANAERLLAQLRSQGVARSFVREDRADDKPLYRVRIGPIPTVPEFDRLLVRLKKLGVADARLALD
jgi:rare lipoprotein A